MCYSGQATVTLSYRAAISVMFPLSTSLQMVIPPIVDPLSGSMWVRFLCNGGECMPDLVTCSLTAVVHDSKSFMDSRILPVLVGLCVLDQGGHDIVDLFRTQGSCWLAQAVGWFVQYGLGDLVSIEDLQEPRARMCSVPPGLAKVACPVGTKVRVIPIQMRRHDRPAFHVAVGWGKHCEVRGWLRGAEVTVGRFDARCCPWSCRWACLVAR